MRGGKKKKKWGKTKHTRFPAPLCSYDLLENNDCAENTKLEVCLVRLCWITPFVATIRVYLMNLYFGQMSSMSKIVKDNLSFERRQLGALCAVHEP